MCQSQSPRPPAELPLQRFHGAIASATRGTELGEERRAMGFVAMDLVSVLHGVSACDEYPHDVE